MSDELKKLAAEFDAAPENAEWNPPHPIFAMAQKIEQQAARIAELEQQRGGVVLLDRESVIRKAVGMCNRIPGSTTWNAAEFAYDELVARLNPPRKFRLGDPVRKTKGSQWSGRVVGFYSTEQTPDGYAVESFTEKGSVQIYPGSALEPCEEPAECAGDQAGVMFGFNDKSVMVSQEIYQIFMDRERAYRDAYQGAREDLAIWKRRALEAEEKIRHQDQIIDRLTLEAQGETRFGEPVVGECVAVPVEPHNIAQEVREALDRKACPDAWMVVAYEATVRAILAQQGKEIEGCNCPGGRKSSPTAHAPNCPARPALLEQQRKEKG